MLAAPTTPLPAAEAKPATIEIVLAGGRIVRVGADVDPAGLIRIITALEGAR